MPQTDAAGRLIIEHFEGDVLRAYPDPASDLARTGEGSGDPWTIGYGHTGSCAAIGKGNVEPGMTITQAEAEKLLEADLANFERQVNNLCTVPLNSNQFSALVSFAYNEGVNALRTSTLMRLVNQRQFEAAADQFGNWVYANGQVYEGLVRRRAAERALFLTPC